MAFNGSGVYNPPAAPTFPAVPNTTIESSKFNDIITDIAAQGLTKCITRDGQSPATANLPMAGFRHTGVGNAVSATDYAAFGQVPGVKGLIGATDWDNFILIGVYEAEAVALTAPATNFPPTDEVGQLMVLAQGSVIVQAYYTQTGILSRVKIGATWTEWSFVATTINEATTLAIPGTYATINDAMAFLNTKFITPNATVTIEITGTVNVNSWPAQIIDHPQSDRIRIIGVSSAKLQHTGVPANDLIIIEKGARLQLIDDLILEVVTPGGTGVGLHVRSNSACNLGSDFFVDGYNTGIQVVEGSFLTYTGTGIIFDDTIVQNCANIGVSASSGSVVLLTEIDVQTCGRGLFASNGAYIQASLCRSLSNTTDGIEVRSGGVIQFSSSVSDSNGASGLLLSLGGKIQFINSLSTNNAQYGIENDGTSTGTVEVIGSVTLTGNGTAATNGLLLNDGTEITSRDLDITLSPAATFNVRFGTHAAIGAETVTGYITIKDAGGTLRKLAVVS